MPTIIDYKSGFAIGDNVQLERQYFQICGKDTLILPVTNADSITAGATSSDATVNQLNPKMDEMYQVNLIVPRQNLQVYVKQPASTLRWGTNQQSSKSFIHDRIMTFDGGVPLNIFILKEEQPTIQIKNINLVTVTPTLTYIGWKYKIKRLDRVPHQFTALQSGGFD